MRSIWAKVVAGFLTVCLPSGLLLSQQPDAFESLLASAQQAQARSDFRSAAEFYRQASALHPEIPELKANLGLMYYQMEENRQAAEVFLQALQVKPALFVPNLFLGLDYIRLKRFKEAVPHLKRAALSKPEDAQSYLGLGQAYAGLGDTRLAIDSYQRATQVAPADADNWYHLGVSYLQHVESDARLLLTRYKDSAYLRVLVADNLLEQQAFAPAAEEYQKALLLPSPPRGAHATYGFALIHQQDLHAAEHEFAVELKGDPGSLLAKLGVARLRLEQGATEDAVNTIQEVWNKDSSFLQANLAIFAAGITPSKRSQLQTLVEQRVAAGELPSQFSDILRGDFSSNFSHVQQGDAAPGVDSGKAMTEVGATCASGSYRQCTDLLASRHVLSSNDLRMLAVSAYYSGDYAHAFGAAKRLAATAGAEAEGLYWETKSAQRLATEALARASELNSSSPKLHVLLGDLYRQRKFFPAAEAEYRKALAMAPRDTGALFGLSLALLADNQLDPAFDVAQSAAKNNPDDPELNAVMGEILCAQGEFPAAEPYLKKSLNTKPEYVSHVHALLGTVYAKTDRTQEAIAELKLALSDDKDGHIHYQLARLYLKAGDRESANQAFEISTRLRSEGLNRAAVAMQQLPAENESQ